MSMEVLDGATIHNFVKDEVAFNLLIEDRFASLDSSHDGLLSYAEMVRELMNLRVLETHFGMDEVGLSPDELFQVYRGLFAWFDHDSNGTVELDVRVLCRDEGDDACCGKWAWILADSNGGGGGELPQEGCR